MLVLKVLDAGPKQGYRIAQDIKSSSQGVLDFKEGSLYPILHSQENKGLIESFEQVEKDGRVVTNQLTDEGRRALERQRDAWRQLSVAIDTGLEGA